MTMFAIYMRLLILLIPLSVIGALNITAEGDVRTESNDTTLFNSKIKYLSLSVRKTFSDNKGDRLILFVNGEAHDNLSEPMLHEGYLRYKGPLSRWNITLGRFSLPFGTITAYPSSRYIWAGLEDVSLGLEADDGILFSGVMSYFDYAVSVTRGEGAHGGFEQMGSGLVIGKLSFPVNDDESIVVSASGAVRSLLSHSSDIHRRRRMGSVDIYVLRGGINSRAEIAYGELVDGKVAATLFMDYPVSRKFEINGGYRLLALGGGSFHKVYSGFTTKYRWLTLRGGYTYEKGEYQFNTAFLQLYVQYSVDR